MAAPVNWNLNISVRRHRFQLHRAYWFGICTQQHIALPDRQAMERAGSCMLIFRFETVNLN